MAKCMSIGHYYVNAFHIVYGELFKKNERYKIMSKTTVFAVMLFRLISHISIDGSVSPLFCPITQ